MDFGRLKRITVHVLTLIAVICARSHAAEQSTDSLRAESLLDYTSPYENGFYSTICGYNVIKKCTLCNAVDSYLCVPGFRSSMPILSVMQPGQAPLVVVILGAEGKTSSSLAKTWVKWLSESGYHVLTFNSSLTPEYINAAGRGVAGNILNEAECSRDIIGAFLKLPNVQGRVTKVGVVGMSYGGIQALLIGKMVADQKVDYKIDAIRAFSPPIDMMQSAQLIDRWWREDRWNYTLQQMYFTIAKHKPVEPGSAIPLSDSMMRAGVAASFRLPFAEVVDANDAMYDLKILPTEDRFMREEYAQTYGFSRFMQKCTFPYWKDKLNIGSYSQLNAVARLTNVLPQEPGFVHAFISSDDPLNRPEDLEILKQCTTCNHLTILKGGGHLGFVNDQWTQNQLANLFKQ